MDKLEKYRQIIKSILTEYASIPVANSFIDCYTIFDTEKDHYQVMNVGWDGNTVRLRRLSVETGMGKRGKRRN
jgi:hypothetical protein